MGKKRKPMDIWFLEQRLEHLVEQEDYERAARVKRWIDELEILYAEREKAIVK
jgi:protein-arginine kinase activator protein McsA